MISSETFLHGEVAVDFGQERAAATRKEVLAALDGVAPDNNAGLAGQLRQLPQ